MDKKQEILFRIKNATVLDKIVAVYAFFEIILSIAAFIWWDGWLVTTFLLTGLEVLQVIQFKKKDKTEVAPHKMSAVVAFVWFLVILIKRIV